MPRDWNSAYETGDTPWDKGYAAPPLEEFLEWVDSGLPGMGSGRERLIEGRVLVPGCGSGHDVRLLAGRGLEVVGLDIAPSAINKAESFPPVGQERYILGDFLGLDPGFYQTFDWVFEHTCLCAIEPSDRLRYRDSLKRALRPGGSYLAVFFREVSNYTGEGPPHPIAAEEIEAMFSCDFEVVASIVPERTYPSRPVGAEQVCWMRLRE